MQHVAFCLFSARTFHQVSFNGTQSPEINHYEFQTQSAAEGGWLWVLDWGFWRRKVRGMNMEMEGGREKVWADVSKFLGLHFSLAVWESPWAGSNRHQGRFVLYTFSTLPVPDLSRLECCISCFVPAMCFSVSLLSLVLTPFLLLYSFNVL